MSQQIPMPIANKLDEPLAELCSGDRGLQPSVRLPVLIEYSDDRAENVVAEIVEAGGEVRHRLNLVRAIAAWVPISAIQRLASNDDVVHLELEQTFSIA